MSLIEDRLVFYINSTNRVSGTDSNFTYQLDAPISEIQAFDKVCVLQALIPNSYYIINSPYNTIQLNENNSIVTITIPQGNYNRKSFSLTVSSLLSTNSPNTLTYTITYPNTQTSVDNGYYTISVINSGLISISLSFPSTSLIYENLGFNSSTSYSFTRIGSTTNYQLVSVNVTQLIAEDALYIHSDICDNKGTSDILQEIYVGNTVTFSAISFQTQSVEGFSKKLASNSKNVFRFTITDENGYPMNFNGVNCLITLMIYKQQDVYRYIKGAIKYFLLKDNSNIEQLK